MIDDAASLPIQLDRNPQVIRQRLPHGILVFRRHVEKHKSLGSRAEELPADGPVFQGALVDVINRTVGDAIRQFPLQHPRLMEQMPEVFQISIPQKNVPIQRKPVLLTFF